MTPEEFVKALRKVVLQRAAASTISAIEAPPGRRPRRDLVEANEWYLRLTEQDRARLRGVAEMVARNAVFGMLAVLDGARVVEDTLEKGTFELAFRKGGSRWDLMPPGGMALHDILNQEGESDAQWL
jgi:hypothetical protein